LCLPIVDLYRNIQYKASSYLGKGQDGRLHWPKYIMIRGILFRQALEKFLKSPVAQNARVQVCLPNGEFYDIKEIRLLENKLIGVRETHRLVLTIEPEKWRMGKVLKKV
jgi:hypothetical protein